MNVENPQQQYRHNEMGQLVPVNIGAPQSYGSTQSDQIASYGSIIKDLMDTNKDMEDFELRLLAKERNDDGKIMSIKGLEPIMDESTAKDFINKIKSVVNKNTHFSKFNEKTVTNVLMLMNYDLNRYLMFQGKRVPLRHRIGVSIEAMNMINASLHKAMEGAILRWSKGQINEGINTSYQPPQRKGIFQYLFPHKGRS